jgi:hypothetical protein
MTKQELKELLTKSDKVMRWNHNPDGYLETNKQELLDCLKNDYCRLFNENCDYVWAKNNVVYIS